MSKLLRVIISVWLYTTAANAQDIEAPLPPDQTLAGETLPLAVYDCSLTSVSRQKIAFKFQVSGGRAYYKDGYVTRTETYVTVLSDPAGILAPYILSAWNGRELRGLDETGHGLFGQYFVADIRQAEQEISARFSGPVLMTIGEHRQPKLGLSPYFTATGYCNAVLTPQLPLSDAELTKLKSK